jgi:uncharacterized protein (TIGR03435 family)
MIKAAQMLVACLLIAGSAHGQTFEVASIKPHPGVITYSADPSVKGNRVTATASTLLDMITTAYHVRYDQVSGGPSWVNSDHFDLDARADGAASIEPEQMRAMLQALLADRFHLKIHHETKDVPMYSLVINKNGPKLRESVSADQPKGRITANGSGMHMEAAQGTMAQLALRLSGNGAGRPVTDKTGLIGKYTYTLDWMNGTPTPDSEWPSLFVALQAQLGLKLESTSGPGEIIVIDQAGKPDAN